MKREEKGFLREYYIRFRVPREFAANRQDTIVDAGKRAGPTAASEGAPTRVDKAWQDTITGNSKEAYIDFVVRYKDTAYTDLVIDYLQKSATVRQGYSISAIRPHDINKSSMTRANIIKDHGGGKLDTKGEIGYEIDLSTMKGVSTFWNPGAEHTIMCVLNLQGYVFLSDSKNPLVFEVTKERGYAHRGGRGVVIEPGGALISLEGISSPINSGYGRVGEAPMNWSQAERKPREGVESVPDKPTMVTVIGREGLYVAYSNGIVRDSSTGLEWLTGPDKDMNWYEAKSWVEGLAIDGGGWRMPTVDELRGLYSKGLGNRNMTPLLKTNGLFIWSVETKDSSYARVFAFDNGLQAWSRPTHSPKRRAFAIRSQTGPEKESVESESGTDGASKEIVKVVQGDAGLESQLPLFQKTLKGRNEVRVKNPNDFSVVAGVRKGKTGINLHIPANGTKSVFVPDGNYEIFFVYSNRPDALFQGDSFTLNNNGVEIRIVKVVDGNYGIRQVK
jgi:hypothetical protein